MNNDRDDIYDNRIKQGLEALAAEVPVPDVAQAFERHRRRREQKNKLHGVAVAALICLLIFAIAPGPAQALRGFIKVTITKILTETSQLYQRTDEGAIIAIDASEIKQFESLSKLQQEQAASLFLPSSLNEEGFIFAEVTYGQSGILSRLAVEYLYWDKPLRFVTFLADSSARFVDIEDFIVQSITVNNVEITAFSDDQGFTLLEWSLDQYTFRLSGNIPVEELLDHCTTSGLFN